MSHLFWAEFKQIENDVFRFNTRIYLNYINEIECSDLCIGAVVGKNPGSAKSSDINNGIQPIILDGDKLLPTVRNIVIKSYDMSGVSIPQRGYIQVLNIFYICERNIGCATTKLVNNKICPNDMAENISFPWVWYVWGGKSKYLNPYKYRFSKLKARNHFYYDKDMSTVITQPATESSFAKHTQGLRHDDIVPHITHLIKSERIIIRS